MALAGGYAPESPVGRRSLGSPDRPANERDGASAPLCFFREHLVALHGFIKKTRATPKADLATARMRRKELER